MTASLQSSRNGKRSSPQDVDLASWATVLESEIPDSGDREQFKRRSLAVWLFHQGQGAKAAAEAAKTSERHFRRMWARCLLIAPDGRPWGYRALLKGIRVAKPVRVKPYTPAKKSIAGFSGLMSMTIELHPTVRNGLINALGRLGPDAYQPVSMKGRQLHLKFLELCREAGISEDEYPFNTIEKGRRALAEWVRRVYLPMHVRSFVKGEHGKSAATVFDFQKDGDQQRAAAKPWDEWQIDEVKVDVRARYELLSADFIPVHLELPRIVAIVCKDTGSGAIPAWKLVIAREVNVGDVLEVLWMAVSGPPKVISSVPDTDYRKDGGFPATVVPQLRFTVPRRLSLDNALAHLANAVRDAVEKACGCEVHLGPPKSPKERANIEAEFSALARKVMHQLPGTTGTGPTDPKRKKDDLPVEGLIRVEDLEHTVDTYFANRNGLPHPASGHTAPLRRLRYMLSRKLFEPQVLPPDKRHAHVFGPRSLAVVHSDLSKSRQPYVWFIGKRYRGQAIMGFAGYKDKKVVIRANPADLRTVVAYDEQGVELGVLRAEGKWGVVPHDLRMRRLFERLRRANVLGVQAEDDPMRALFAHLNKGAQRDATQAAQLAYLIGYLRGHLVELDEGLVTDMREHLRVQPAANDVPVPPVDTVEPPVESSVEPSSIAAPIDSAIAPPAEVAPKPTVPARVAAPPVVVHLPPPRASTPRPAYILPQRTVRR